MIRWAPRLRLPARPFARPFAAPSDAVIAAALISALLVLVLARMHVVVGAHTEMEQRSADAMPTVRSCRARTAAGVSAHRPRPQSSRSICPAWRRPAGAPPVPLRAVPA